MSGTTDRKEHTVIKSKLAGAVVAGVLGVAVTGAAAFAAFQPPDTTPVAGVVAGIPASQQVEKEGAHDRIKDVLDKLVRSGTITQLQEDAIIKAFKEASERDRDGDKHLKQILGDLMKLSADYLGLPKGQIEQGLKDGKSLGEIATATPNRSRDGLIKFLVEQVTAQIDKAVADGKITKEQAAKVKAHLTEHITKFVDHKFQPKARPNKPAAPKPTPTPTPTPKA